MILAIDIGNTRTKFIAFGEKKEVLHQGVLPTQDLDEKLPGMLADIPSDTALRVGWISTARPFPVEDMSCWDRFSQSPQFFPITAQSELPIRNAYATPETLGADRIVSVIGACSYFPDTPVLVIDAGTAITYDVADAKGTYLGGAIAPGMEMRFKALHHFTARLPKVDFQGKTALVGDSTVSSIRSGVVNGTIEEIKGMVKKYKKVLGPSTQVFLTGGDRHFFEMSVKKLNFASSNLVLEGIYTILKYKSTL